MKHKALIGGILILIIALIAIITYTLLNASNVSVAALVVDADGNPASNVSVTLWHDGKIVKTQNNRIFQDGYNHSWLMFDNLHKDYYCVIGEKNGYIGWSFYDRDNPLPLWVNLLDGPNVTGVYLNRTYINPAKVYGNSNPAQFYYNVSKSEIDGAISVAMNNSSVQSIVNGTDNRILYVDKRIDMIGQNPNYKVYLWEQPKRMENETGWSWDYSKFGNLSVYVDIEQNKVIKIA
ncbi:MAG: hypothetical protein WBZ29_13615 [Methanocella sp.]